MKVARLYGVDDVRLTDEPVPTPGPDHELIRIAAVGLCGSDLHWYRDGGIGDDQLTTPLVVGHEFAGVVEGGPRHGRLVAVDPAIPCEQCEVCRSGHHNLCPTVVFAGHSNQDGALQEFISWPRARLHPLPAALDATDGALLEPLGVALHALDLGQVKLGMTVGVFGCGPIGLLLIQAARAAGATVIASELLGHRRDAARRLGADDVTDPASDQDGGRIANRVDVAFEAAGTDEAIETALAAARPGARVVLAGIPDHDHTTFKASLARRKGLSLVLSRRMNHVYPRAIRLVEQGHIDVRSVVTHRYQLDEIDAALKTAVAREGLKVVVHPSDPHPPAR
jgi:L-iditol 2-dehydrogenase